MPETSRPSPEQMLERARAEETSRGRGKLKVFFGYAPGVGKTYAMLEAARARKREGVDVVIGWVETHGRTETDALTEGLERIPPRQIEYRGVRLAEMDLETAIARRPALLLVDELAHTNAEGSKHAHRWQDVQDLLDAGIDVYSTLNVQHLESMNDLVAQITTVSVKERVPDSVLDRAVEVELVDLTPEVLLQRLREGRVYVPAQAARAMTSFFQQGNLIALRELALRRTAEGVDAQMASWKRDHGVERPWPTAERILVAVGPSPDSANLVRSAYRMARRLHAPWIALSVETPEVLRLGTADRDRVASHLALAERLGAEVLVTAGEDAAQAILDVAHQRNVSRIVVGKPARHGVRALLQGSLVWRLTRGSGPIDVLITSGEGEAARPKRRAAAAEKVPFPLREYLWGALTVVAATAIGSAGKPFLNLADEAMIYLLGVLFVASRFSRGPALFVSIASVAALDFFFVPPFYTFSVNDLRFVITFGVLLVTGLLVANLTLRIRSQAASSREREQRTSVLYMMSRSLAFRSAVADIAETIARHVEILFDVESALLLPSGDGRLAVRGGTAGDLPGSEKEMAVARWAFEHGQPAGFGTETLPDADRLFLPLAGGKATLGVVALALRRRPHPLDPSHRQILDVFLSHASLAMERALLTEEAEKAQVDAETERLRNALLASVSHDLRTPLAAVTGAATSLLEEGERLPPPARRELLSTIREEAERLDRVMSNLLHITQLESGRLKLRKEWCPLEEVIGAALARLESKIGSRPVRVDLPTWLLEAPFDATLMEQVLVNLVENALKYTPGSAPIEIRGARSGENVLIEVSDRGPGIPTGEEERIFDRYERGTVRGDVAGTGLGLAVCRAAVKAHGGRIWVENREGGGASFKLMLPLEGSPPDHHVRDDPVEDPGA